MKAAILCFGTASLAIALSTVSSSAAACRDDGKKPSIVGQRAELDCPDEKKPSLACPGDKKPSLACPDGDKKLS